jgi:proteasome lid subunit RPN8/RPN11
MEPAQMTPRLRLLAHLIAQRYDTVSCTEISREDRALHLYDLGAMLIAYKKAGMDKEEYIPADLENRFQRDTQDIVRQSTKTKKLSISPFDVALLGVRLDTIILGADDLGIGRAGIADIASFVKEGMSDDILGASGADLFAQCGGIHGISDVTELYMPRLEVITGAKKCTKKKPVVAPPKGPPKETPKETPKRGRSRTVGGWGGRKRERASSEKAGAGSTDVPMAPPPGSGKIFLPKELVPKFRELAKPYIKAKIEVGGFLFGYTDEEGNKHVCTLVLPKQVGYEGYFEQIGNSDYVQDLTAASEAKTSPQLILIGWIHLHPTQSITPSTIDINMHNRLKAGGADLIGIIVSGLSAFQNKVRYFDTEGRKAIGYPREKKDFEGTTLEIADYREKTPRGALVVDQRERNAKGEVLRPHECERDGETCKEFLFFTSPSSPPKTKTRPAKRRRVLDSESDDE